MHGDGAHPAAVPLPPVPGEVADLLGGETVPRGGHSVGHAEVVGVPHGEAAVLELLCTQTHTQPVTDFSDPFVSIPAA